MQLWITCDANWEARVSRVLSILVNRRNFFDDKVYGSEVERVSLILMCRYPDLNFAKRTKFYRKKREFYTDIMLEYSVIVNETMTGRMKYVAEQIYIQLAEHFAKRKFADFDASEFLIDIKEWLSIAVDQYDGHGDGAWRY